MERSLSIAWSRLRRRGTSIALNALNALVLPLLNPLISLLVIRRGSAELWGGFVQILLVVQLASHVLTWGNKDYLLREFSQQPARISETWQRCLTTRCALLALGAPLLLLLGWPIWRVGLILVWLLAATVDQAHEALIIYRKAFLGQLAVELGELGLTLAGALWLLGAGALTVDGLVIVFTLVEVAKAGALLLWLRPLRRGAWRIDPAYFGLALPFFLLGLSGMLQSRIDQYAVNTYLSAREVAQYQIFVNFLIYLQSLAALLLIPFIKGMYRLRYASLLKLSLRLLALGLALIGPALAVIGLVLSQLYHLDLPLGTLLLGGLATLPVYYYLPVIYALYKAGRQTAVLRINLLGVAANLLLILALMRALRIDGALIANAGAQWAMLLAYLRQTRTLREDSGTATLNHLT